MNCTKTDCPAAQQCPKVQYRGSICAALRDEHGLGDPLTNADKIRDMTDEELAKMFLLHDDQVYRHCPSDTLAEYCQVKPASECCDCDKCWLDWLKQEVSDNGKD